MLLCQSIAKDREILWTNPEHLDYISQTNLSNNHGLVETPEQLTKPTTDGSLQRPKQLSDPLHENEISQLQNTADALLTKIYSLRQNTTPPNLYPDAQPFTSQSG